MNIVLGVGGGIAAYKACHVLRELREVGHSVRVVPTDSALRFVGAPTWEALSSHPVATDVFTRVDEVEHVMIGQRADLVLIAPATADLLAKLRAGLADDLLTATVLATGAPVVVAPAMHTEMWFNPATVDNVATLRARGVHVIEPASGRLTGRDSGPGRLPEPHDIVRIALDFVRDSPQDRAQAAQTEQPTAASAAARARTDAGTEAVAGTNPVSDALPHRQVLSGQRVLISAGGTREPIDPVRFLGNKSSGKQGVALAKAAAASGATVEFVCANVEAQLLSALPGSVRVHPVESARELQDACTALASDMDVIIMAAAVADYRPASVAEHKMKKDGDDGLTLTLVQNPDVLRGLVVKRAEEGWEATIVGFAAETGSPEHTPEQLAAQKFARKGCDLLVLNDVSGGCAFGRDENTVSVLGSVDGEVRMLQQISGDKDNVSREVIEVIAGLQHT